MPASTILSRLRALDPAGWGTGLSPANVRACWSEALDDLAAADLTGPLPGSAPACALIIASANVFTAPLRWLLHLCLRGVPVRVKAARGLIGATRAMCAPIPGAAVQDWRGGDDRALRLALSGDPDAPADPAGTPAAGVIAFGRQETMDAVRAACAALPSPPPLLAFGPRFSLGWSAATPPALAADIARDLARYDSRGCMSPAAWICPDPDPDALAAALAGAQTRWPRGEVTPAEAAALRSRTLLARAAGAVRSGDGWTLLLLPARHFSPAPLPRTLTVHPDAPDLPADLLARLSTLAHDGSAPPWLCAAATRRCAPGEMQRPPAGPWHDGQDVLSALWRAPQHNNGSPLA